MKARGWGRIINVASVVGLVGQANAAAYAASKHGTVGLTRAVALELRASVPGIWALGDCNGKGAFTHTSDDDFEIGAANIRDCHDRCVSDRIVACNLYADRPLGRARMTEGEVRKSGRRALMSMMAMENVNGASE